MLPVAWTKGTDFRLAPRTPARDITFFDAYGRTFETGPQPGNRFADGPGTVVETDIDAPAAAVWAVVTDINVPAAFSTEFKGAEWEGAERGVGSTFLARNNHPAVGEYEIRCWIDTWEEHRSFGWRTSDPDQPGARWRFDLEQGPGRTRLRFTAHLGPGSSGTSQAVEQMPEKEERIVLRRIREIRPNMQRTVDGIKQLAERQPSAEGQPPAEGQ
jgi:Polyketide cyclase / dehydrase and lipid transport